jgi:hypothetical protein
VLKFDASLTRIWNAATTAGDGAGKLPYSIAVDSCGMLWISGSMANSGLGTPTPHTLIFPGYTLHDPSGSYDPMFIAAYDTAGNYLTSTAFTSGGDDNSSIMVNNKGSFILSGDIVDVTTMQFGSTALHFPSTHEALFLAKYKYDSSGCSIFHFPPLSVKQLNPGSQNITCFPNPACTMLNISAGEIIRDLSIYNLTGQRVYSNEYNSVNVEVPVASLAPGLYFIKINGIYLTKFLKE